MLSPLPTAAKQDPAHVAELLRLSRGGSPEAFTEIVRLHQRSVRVFLGRHLRGKDVVDDLAQEVFVAAYQRLGTYREDASLVSWLLGIARIRLLLYLRATRRRRAHEAGAGEAALIALSLERLEADEPHLALREREAHALEECMERLPPASAALVKQHYLSGRGAVEIAAETGKGAGAVRMSLLRIRQALRDCVKRRLEENRVWP